MVRRTRSLALVLLALLSLVASSCSVGSPVGSGSPGTPVAGKPPVYVHYYLWWSQQHWNDKLGTAYPYGANPLPQPGALGPDGCGATVNYPGATITDIPTEGLYDQEDPATFDRHIATAAAAGIRGFTVSWQGTGNPTQDPASSGYNRRLDLLVGRVNAYNATHAVPFNLALGLSAFGNYSRPASAILADLGYFTARYGSNPAFNNQFSAKPLAMILASRKYTGSQVPDLGNAFGSKLFLISDDTNKTWAAQQQYFSGASWYWSSQNPYNNPQSGSQVKELGDQVHGAHKLLFAPFAPGFNDELAGRSCTPRNGISTLTRVWSMNQQSRPDAWFGISWNEFVEHTYLQPTKAFGTQQLDALRLLIAGQ
jgi:hypothetical protein